MGVGYVLERSTLVHNRFKLNERQMGLPRPHEYILDCVHVRDGTACV